MSKIRLIAVGLLKSGPEFDLYHQYAKRLNRSIGLIELKTGNDFITHIHSKSYTIACDEGGENLSTEELYRELCNHSSVTFLIGGADGFPPNLPIQRKIAFGRLTWPHLLVRALLIEQIYRCQQIGLKHPYHRA